MLSSFRKAPSSGQTQTVIFVLLHAAVLSLLSQHRVSSSKALRPRTPCKQDERSRRLIFTILTVIKHFNPCQKCLAVKNPNVV